MKVYICSPYKYNPGFFKSLAKQYCWVVIKAGFIPFAPHLYFSTFLNEENEKDRMKVKEMAYQFMKECGQMWVFTEWCIKEEMKEEVDYWKKNFPDKTIKYID